MRAPVLVFVLSLSSALCEPLFFQHSHESPDGLFVHDTKGELAEWVNLDTEPEVLKVLCEGNTVLVAHDDAQAAVTRWAGKHLLVGGASWGCSSRLDTGHWDGLFRRIVSVQQYSERVVEVTTTAASFFDAYSHADVHYEYRRNPPGGSHSRKKRDTDNSANSQSNTLARWLVEGMDFERTQPSLNVNFTETVSMRSTNPGITWEVTCNDCDANFDMEVLFKLKKTLASKSFTFQLSGDVTLDFSITTEVGEELSREGKMEIGGNSTVTFPHINIFPSPGLSIPGLDLHLMAEVKFFADINLKAGGKTKVEHNFQSEGSFVAALEITDDAPPSLTVTYTPKSLAASIDDYLITGEASLDAVIYPQVTVTPSMKWSYGEALHWVDLKTPMSLQVLPHFSHTVTNEVGKVCLETELTGTMRLVANNMPVELYVLGAAWWQEDLIPGNTSQSGEMWKDVAIPCRDCCDANCDGPVQVPEDDVAIETVVGPAESTPAARSDMVTVDSVDILWKVSDKLLSGDLALRVISLAGLVKARWKDRVLIVTEGWKNEAGLQGDGRAAKITITEALSGAPGRSTKADDTLLEPLSQLAVCAGLHYSRVQGDQVLIAVSSAADLTPRRAYWKRVLEGTVGIANPDCEKWKTKGYFAELSRGATYPEGKTAADVCGPATHRITRQNAEEFSRFYYYALDDVKFADEEASHAWCGAPSRACVPCDAAAAQPWQWCADRVMSSRLASRLRRLAALTYETIGGGVKVEVLDSWHEATSSSSNEWGNYDKDSLHYEGRMARLKYSNGGGLNRMTSLAACAGFDWISYTNNGYIEVCVRNEAHDGGVAVPFLETNLLSVDAPMDSTEYAYPTKLENEEYKGYLFDTHGIEDQLLSKNFKMSDFMYPSKRFVRIDNRMVECLQIVRENFEHTIVIPTGSGYRPRSINLQNLDMKHPQETDRFPAGQAVELKISGPNTEENLKTLANTILRRCASRLKFQNRGIGLGLHNDRIYLDIRESSTKNQLPHVEVWSTGYDMNIHELQQTATEINKGGPEVNPVDDLELCRSPLLGQGNEYFSFTFGTYRDDCGNDTLTVFCGDTEEDRERIHREFLAKYKKRVVVNPRDDEATLDAIRQCIVQYCGRCQGAGEMWRSKVEACLVVFNFYKDRVAQPSLHNTMAFFDVNSETEELHEAACRTRLCITKTDGYLLFNNIVSARFKPDPAIDVEEELYGSGENPSPVVDIMEQGYAMMASGNVSVFMEKEQDLSKLAKVLKVLMVYNRKVDMVTIHCYSMSEIAQDHVRESLQRKLEVWSGTVCPRWSRAAIAPFKMETVSSNRRRKRSTRGQLFHEENNWELKWIMRDDI